MNPQGQQQQQPQFNANGDMGYGVQQEVAPPMVYNDAAVVPMVPVMVPQQQQVQQVMPAPVVNPVVPVVERSARVFVGNLSWQTDWQELKDHMRQAGEVVRCDVLRGNDGRSKGSAIVEYRTTAEALNAMATLQETELNSRPIFVREDREAPGMVGNNNRPRQHQGNHPQQHMQPHQHNGGVNRQNRRVYVGNLSWDVAWQDLKDHMRLSGGEILRADVMTEANTGRSKGCGIVEYATPEQAQAATAQLNNTEIKGRLIFVREDREQGPPMMHNQQHMAPMHQQHPHHHPHHHHSSQHPPHQGGPVYGGYPMQQHHHQGPHQGHHQQGHPQQHQQHQQQQGMHYQGGRQGPGVGVGGTRVYIGNLSWEVTWQDLKDHCRRVGNVIHADVLQDQDGRSRGCGVVEYDNFRAAQKAIRDLNNSSLQGRQIFVREDREAGNFNATRPGGGLNKGVGNRPQQRNGLGQANAAPSPQVFVGNMSFDTTRAQLKEHFDGCGEVTSVTIMTDPVKNRSKGWATVRFNTIEEAQQAIATLNGSSLMGRNLEVRNDSKYAVGGGAGGVSSGGGDGGDGVDGTVGGVVAPADGSSPAVTAGGGDAGAGGE